MGGFLLWSFCCHLGVHVDEAVGAPGGKGGPPHHSAVMEMVMVLQAADLKEQKKKAITLWGKKTPESYC